MKREYNEQRNEKGARRMFFFLENTDRIVFIMEMIGTIAFASSGALVASPYTNMAQMLLDTMDREYPSFEDLPAFVPFFVFFRHIVCPGHLLFRHGHKQLIALFFGSSKSRHSRFR